MKTIHMQSIMTKHQTDEAARSFCGGLEQFLDGVGQALTDARYPAAAEGAAMLRSQADELCLHDLAEAAAALELAANAGNAIACSVHYGALRRHAREHIG
ncbi:MAG: hypothetical protein LBC99_08020 [Spirochaetota bacterium]|jgi:hypothetical protein|nr:hypothetical protein [Spirochaetota bacterium]